MANGGKATMAGPHAQRISSAGGKATTASHGPQLANGGKVGGKATMAGPHAQRISSKGGKVGGLQADPAKQLPGGPCNKCNRTESIRWYAAGTQCKACYMAEHREKKRLAEQKGRQTIEQAFTAAAAKKQKQE